MVKRMKYSKKRKYKRRLRSRRYGRKYGKRHVAPAKVGRFNGLGGFPDVYQTKVVYQDIGQLTNPDALTEYTFWKLFRLNNVYDAEVTVATGQRSASYYNILRELYASYRVLGAKIHVTFTPGDASGTSYLAVLWPFDASRYDPYNGFASISAEKVGQWPRAITKSGIFGQDTVVLSKYVSPTEIVGQPRSAIRIDGKYSFDVDSKLAPSLLHDDTAHRNILAAIGFQKFGDTGSATTMDFKVKITYYVEFYDRKATRTLFSEDTVDD